MLLALTLVTSALTILAMYALAHKKRLGWHVSLLNQPLWFMVIFMTHAWGLLILQAFMVLIAIHGLRNWGKASKCAVTQFVDVTNHAVL